MAKISYEIENTEITQAQLDGYINMLATAKGWTEQIPSGDEDETMIDNPVSQMDTVAQMVDSYLKGEIRAIVMKQKQEEARVAAVAEID